MAGSAISRVFLLLLMTIVSAYPLSAQSGNFGSLQGTVGDPSGAVVPGAAVRATDRDRGAFFVTTSNADGLFLFPALPVGNYELSAERAGFAIWEEKNIEVTVGSEISRSIVLLLPGMSESVSVREPASLLETSRSQTSFTVGERAVSSLPVNGRNYLDFVLLTPGVTRGSGGSFDLSFGGQRKMNLLRVDGADNDDTFFGEFLGLSRGGQAPFQFSMSTVQEFQVNTNSYAAEYGRAGAGLINVVTKSGTNEFHGLGFWYYRDRALNASDLVNRINNLPKSPYHFNQFGGTLGGPVRKNKLFFFVAYDGQSSTLQNVVTLNLPAGFSFSADPRVAGFQQLALAYLGPRASSWLRTFDQNVFFAKLDWRINSAHLLTGRWNRHRFIGGNLLSAGPQNSLEHTGNTNSFTDTLAISLSSSVSPSVANFFLFAYVRSRDPVFSNSPNPEANVFEGGHLVLSVGRNSPSERDIDRLQWSDTISWLHGRHAFKFGTDVLPNRITFLNTVNFSGSFRFPSLESFGRSLAGAPPAIPDQRSYIQAFSGTGAHGVTVDPDFTDYAGFAQDEWRVSQRLTLNLGLRYDLQVIHKPTVRNPNPALAAAGIDTSRLRTDKNNFAPRIGLAWSPFTSNQIVLRAGFGLFFARTPSIISARPLFQNGITVVTDTFAGGTSNAFIIPSYPNNICGPPDPSGLPPNCAAPPAAVAGNQILQVYSPSYAQPYTQQGSFGLEFEISKDFAISANYLLVKGTHLQRWRDVNLATPETPASIGIAGTLNTLSYGKLTLPRPIAGFDRILQVESAASSIYHALALNLERRYSRGFQLSAAYTFSKTIDDNPEPVAVNPPSTDNLLLLDATNPRADRSLGVNDQRHRFVLSGVWRIRGEQLHPGSARVFLSGWELSSILTAQSGLPYSGYVSSDLNNDGNNSNDRTPGLGRNTFRLPLSVSLDARLTWNVPLTERVRLQVLSEAFNVLNHGNITSVRTTEFGLSASALICGIATAPCLVPQNSGLSAFRTPTATSGPRIIQLAARLIF